MNKNIKRIIAITLIMSIYSAMEPTKYISLTSTAAQAETTSTYLESLSMNKADINFDSNKTNYSVNVGGDESEIKITAVPKNKDSEVLINDDIVDSSDKYKKEVHLDQGENIIKIKVSNNDGMSKIYTVIVTKGESSSDEVYLSSISLGEGNINFQKETRSYDVEVKSETDKIKIIAKPEDNDDTVRVNGTSVTEDNGYEETIDLEKGKNQVIIDVENKKDKKRSYILNITRKDNSNGAEAKDNIYLELIKVSDTEINASKDKTSYDFSVKTDIDRTTVKVEPEDTKYMVEINGDAVLESENYEKYVNLNNNKTEVKVKIEDSNGKKRIYTINIYKGAIPAVTTATTNTANTVTNNSTDLKINQWVQVNNKWQYNDITGNVIKNAWFYDRSYGKTYYLQADGSMATGWLNNNGKWYYLGSDGGMKTGWVLVGSKYYYFYSYGAMACSTTVDGYNVGADGAWN